MHNLADNPFIHRNIFKIAEFGLNFAISDSNLDRFIKRYKNSIASAKRQLSNWIKSELKGEKADPSNYTSIVKESYNFLDAKTKITLNRTAHKYRFLRIRKPPNMHHSVMRTLKTMRFNKRFILVDSDKGLGPAYIRRSVFLAAGKTLLKNAKFKH